jgi:hypothetical protein
MRLEMEVRGAEEVGRFVEYVFADQLPFVTSKAINDTAKEFQKRQRAHMERTFTIRVPGFMRQTVKILPFATKDSLQARVAIESPRGKDGRPRSDIFAKFETDRTKTPSKRFIAVPTEHVPRKASGVVQNAWRPGRVIKRNFKDGFRTFVREKNGRRAIYFEEPRDGMPGKILPLYWLVEKVPIEPDLDFVKTANRTVDEVWAPNFTAAFDRAIRTAR